MAIRLSGLAVVTAALLQAPALAQQPSPRCAADNAGLALPEGFCALVVADGVGPARHLTVAPNGDVIVAIARSRQGDRQVDGGVLVLRDTTRDGAADVQRRFAGGAGSQVLLHDGSLYYATSDAVLRFAWPAGALEPSGPADTVVKDLPSDRSHARKTMAIGAGSALYVNIGSPTNSCQATDRTSGLPGVDPCDQLQNRAGIWRFDATRTNQSQADGSRYATGMRNSVAVAIRPHDGQLYAAIHGRDQLYQNWGALGFDSVAGAEKPAEEFVRVQQGDDFGWPYCYFDPQSKKKVLSPRRRLPRVPRLVEPRASAPGWV